MQRTYLKDGTFCLGANYWASHAGTAMWQKWDEKIVEDDFQRLSSNEVKILRVFPLLSDFQPITLLHGCMGEVEEVAHGEKFLDKTTEEGRCGIDVASIEKFKTLCRLAEKYDIKLIVPLITGWMSGRNFFPTAFNGRNMLNDPFCVQWEVRFVQYFVKTFKNEPTIIAWELGNECNCIAPVTDEEAWMWTHAIVSATKAIDPDRPFLSGMHGLTSGGWKLEGQAELCDLLTIHPYMLFTPYCALDPILSPRAILHSPAELTMYADLGGKNCLVEEIGSLSGNLGDEESVGLFAKANLLNAWIHNGIGMLWWCAFEQKELTEAPYDWCDVERELGMFRQDKTEKPTVVAYKEFAQFLKKLPFEELPKRRRNAICLVDDKDWKSSFGAFMLAKRAGFELQFADRNGKIEPSPLYILPSGEGTKFLYKRTLDPLMEQVKKGSVLLITCGETAVCPFVDVVGCRSKGRKKSSVCRMQLDGEELCIPRPYVVDLVKEDVEVLAFDEEGIPALTYRKLGKGAVVFLNAPIETAFAETAEIASGKDCGYEKVYSCVRKLAGIRLPVEKTNPLIDVTEHELEGGMSVIIVMNNTNESQTDTLALCGVELQEVLYGEVKLAKNQVKVCVPAAETLIFTVKKK